MSGSTNADVVGFFKNNEYTSPISKGETFPGVRVLPVVAYQVANKFRVELGATGLFYSGVQQKDESSAFNGIHAKLQYAINPKLNLILGNYNGGVNHRLIEPLYKWETHLTGKSESGLQLVYDSEKYFVDTWLNWQRFIQRGDSVPEILTFGLSASIKLSKAESRMQFSLPLQLVAHHQGGQIDVSSEKMITTANLATGLCSSYSLDGKFLKAVGMSMYFAGYYDVHPDKELRPYARGWGLYPVISLEASHFKAMVGYWYSNKYYSFDGEPLFASFNLDYPGILLPTRSVLTAKLAYAQQVHKMVAIGVQGESYLDLKRGGVDYNFGVYLRFKYSGIK